jgi:hypothetical protein
MVPDIEVLCYTNYSLYKFQPNTIAGLLSKYTFLHINLVISMWSYLEMFGPSESQLIPILKCHDTKYLICYRNR